MRFTLKLVLSILLLTFMLGALQAQKFEFGVGLGINHSNISEDIRSQVGSIDGIYKGHRLPAINTRLGYKLNDRFHINSGFGMSWLGALTKDVTMRVIASTAEIPLQLELNVTDGLSLSSGFSYNHILNISSGDTQTTNDLLQNINSRHQIGLKHGIAYGYKRIELSINYTHYLTNLFELNLTDENGNNIGSLISKFRNIQLGVLFRV